MQRYRIKIEYEGTPFVGWQFQKNGQSVQEVLQKAIFNFSKEKVVFLQGFALNWRFWSCWTVPNTDCSSDSVRFGSRIGNDFST